VTPSSFGKVRAGPQSAEEKRASSASLGMPVILEQLLVSAGTGKDAGENSHGE